MKWPVFHQIFTILTTLYCVSCAIVAAQNCGCAPDQCCSQWGLCGYTDDYCGDGCQQGPCHSSNPVSVLNLGTDTFFNPVLNLVTDTFFNSIINQASSGCAGKTFYSRSSFLSALNFYPLFGTGGTFDDNTREVASFFAHVTHETGHFCFIDEIVKATYCQASTTWPCNPKKEYYGRGPIHSRWNYNYGPAGQSIGFDGLNAPETVANDPVVAFRTAFWFWMNNVHSIIISDQGFGATIRAINGGECNGGNTPAVAARVSYYTEYCSQFGVSPGNNLYC